MFVGGLQVANSHRVVNCVSHIGGSDRVVFGILAESIAGTERLASLNSAAGEQVRQAVSPVIATCTFDSAGSRIANLWRTSHFTRDHEKCLIQQLFLRQIFNQCGKAAIEFRQQVFLQAVKSKVLGKILPFLRNLTRDKIS